MVVVACLVGGILQVTCYDYLRTNTFLLENKTGKIRSSLRKVHPIDRVLKVIIKNGIPTILFITKNGVLISLSCTAIAIVHKRHTLVLFRYVYGSLPYSYSTIGKRFFEPFPFQYCLDPDSFKGWLTILNDDTFSLPVKSAYTYKVLVKNLNLNTTSGRVRCVICLASMIVFLTTTNNIVGLSLFIQNLIVAIKTGQISKKMAREIIKLLMRAGLNIDPELLDAAG